MGGVVMPALLFMSIIALGLILLKLWQFYQYQVFRKTITEKMVDKILKNESDIQTEMNSYKHPAIQVLQTCLDCLSRETMSNLQIRTEVNRVGSKLIRELESYLRGLAAIAHLSPLLGLLGTVIGIIEAFIKLQQAGSKVDPSLLAGGIWAALLTTAAGLAIAIPTMACLYYLEGIVDRVQSEMKDSSMQILSHFGRIDD